MGFAADILVVTVLVLHTLTGMHRGFLVSLLGVLGLACAVGAAHAWAAPAGALLREWFEVDPLLSTPLAGTAVFLVVSILFGLVTHVVRRHRRRREREEKRSSLSFVSRIGGGIIGLAVGAVFMLVLLWTYDALSGGLPGVELPDISASTSASLARQVVGAGARRVLAERMEDPQATALAASIAAPGATATNLTALLSEPAVAALFRDPLFRKEVLSGDAEAIAANPVFRGVLVDGGVTNRLLDMGLAAPPYASEKVASAWADPIADLGGRFHAVLSDPEIAEALEGLREDGVFEAQDWRALVSDRRTLQIAWEVLTAKEPTTEEETTKADDHE